MISSLPWWRQQMETFSAILALCVGNSPVTGEFPSQRPVTRSFDVFFDLCLNKQLSKQPGRDLRRNRAHDDVIVMSYRVRWEAMSSVWRSDAVNQGTSDQEQMDRWYRNLRHVRVFGEVPRDSQRHMTRPRRVIPHVQIDARRRRDACKKSDDVKSPHSSLCTPVWRNQTEIYEILVCNAFSYWLKRIHVTRALVVGNLCFPAFPKDRGRLTTTYKRNISMVSCKTAVSPLLKHWRYCSLARSHRFRAYT